jgi:hypothetical protein
MERLRRAGIMVGTIPIMAIWKPLRLGEIIQAVRRKLSIPLVAVATSSGSESTSPRNERHWHMTKGIRE